jgi:hypothetical protein
MYYRRVRLCPKKPGFLPITGFVFLNFTPVCAKYRLPPLPRRRLVAAATAGPAPLSRLNGHQRDGGKPVALVMLLVFIHARVAAFRRFPLTFPLTRIPDPTTFIAHPAQALPHKKGADPAAALRRPAELLDE